jgi:hypothetical protein
MDREGESRVSPVNVLCDVLCVITLPFYPVRGHYFQCRLVQEGEKRFAPNSNPSLQFRTVHCIEVHPQVVNCHGRGREFESRRPRHSFQES